MEDAYKAVQALGTSLAVVFMDGNGFKKINDKFGHLVGDQVIEEMSNEIVECLRPSDQVFRFGGDEFVLFLKNMEQKSIRDFIVRIQRRLGKNKKILNLTKAPLTVSMGGVAVDWSKHLVLDLAITEADSLMYAAKKAPPDFIVIAGEGAAKTMSPDNEPTYIKRREDYAGFLEMVLFREIINCDYEILTKAIVEVFAINGNKMLYRAPPNDALQLIRSNYSIMIAKKQIEEAKNLSAPANLQKQTAFVNDFKDFLTTQKKAG
jgi:diguanylate cyclase (GGDEF)-like protein